MVIFKSYHIKIWQLEYGDILAFFQKYGNMLYGDIFGNLGNMVKYQIARLVRKQKI